MDKVRITLFLVACFLCSIVSANYCNICKNHTMCKYKAFGRKCTEEGKKIGNGGVSQNEKELILNLHNKYRRLVAKGLEPNGKPGPQPKAANMRQLVWDEELAIIAQRWADQCDFSHDECKDVSRFKVGQNIFWEWGYPKPVPDWKKAIGSWYDEVKQFDPSIINNYQFQLVSGHYTQIMWHNTESVGCGRRLYGNEIIYVCNYGPAGNYLTQPMYSVGEPCSKCPSKTFCNDGLCVPDEENEIQLEDTDGLLPKQSLNDAESDVQPSFQPEINKNEEFDGNPWLNLFFGQKQDKPTIEIQTENFPTNFYGINATENVAFNGEKETKSNDKVEGAENSTSEISQTGFVPVDGNLPSSLKPSSNREYYEVDVVKNNCNEFAPKFFPCQNNTSSLGYQIYTELLSWFFPKDNF